MFCCKLQLGWFKDERVWVCFEMAKVHMQYKDGGVTVRLSEEFLPSMQCLRITERVWVCFEMAKMHMQYKDGGVTVRLSEEFLPSMQCLRIREKTGSMAPGGGGGVMPYICHTETCRRSGYTFWPSNPRQGVFFRA